MSAIFPSIFLPARMKLYPLPLAMLLQSQQVIAREICRFVREIALHADALLQPSLVLKVRMKPILSAFVALSIALSGNSAMAADPSDNPFLRAFAYMDEYGFFDSDSGWNLYPDAPVSRVEFLQLVTRYVFPIDIIDHCLEEIASSPTSQYTILFTDVRRDSEMAKYVCTGMQTGIVSGYSDGSYRPGKIVNMAEAAKILVKAYHLAPSGRQNDPRTPWYTQYVFDLSNRGGVPGWIRDPGKPLTRRDVAGMFYGLRNARL